MKYRLTLSSALVICILINISAQTSQNGLNTQPGSSRFLLRGYADGTFVSNEEESTFGDVRFVPVFLYKQSDKLFFEGELEFSAEDGMVEVAVEYANFSYELAPNVRFRAGKILTQFGIFFDRLHPSWINRLPTNPLGYGHDGILPSSDLGMEIRGASYLGAIKINYSAYVMNGPRLNDGSEEPDEVGLIMHEPGEDNNNNKAIGGRLGLFPFKNQSLELGFSAQKSKLGTKGSEFKNIGAVLFAFDWTYVKNISFFGGIVDFKGQVNFVNVDDYEYTVIEDGIPEMYFFENKSRTTFYQLTYRPTFGPNFIKNLEIASRYSTMATPEEAPWESESEQTIVGLNYWIDWRTAIKLAYQFDEITGGHGADAGTLKSQTFFIQWTIGF